DVYVHGPAAAVVGADLPTEISAANARGGLGAGGLRRGLRVWLRFWGVSTGIAQGLPGFRFWFIFVCYQSVARVRSVGFARKDDRPRKTMACPTLAIMRGARTEFRWVRR
ncbi:MAG: hypothetical protein JWQ87_1532, partial [Candidatus Sulfotelmatobacter sp.]|nr:hypothetical protein [Candidatus Sulfotelmatobacter sp.]